MPCMHGGMLSAVTVRDRLILIRVIRVEVITVTLIQVRLLGFRGLIRVRLPQASMGREPVSPRPEVYCGYPYTSSPCLNPPEP